MIFVASVTKVLKENFSAEGEASISSRKARIGIPVCMRGMREFQYDNPEAYFTYLLFFMRIKKFRDLYADQA